MRKKGKVDINQGFLVNQLRQCGFSVQVLSGVGQGCPDLLISCGGITKLVEVKKDKKAKLTADQVKFITNWNDRIIIATCLDDVLEHYRSFIQ